MSDALHSYMAVFVNRIEPITKQGLDDLFVFHTLQFATLSLSLRALPLVQGHRQE